MKLFYKLLILVILDFSILLYIENTINEINVNRDMKMLNESFGYTEENLVEEKEELEVSDVITLESIFPLNNMYKVDNGKGNLYTLSYMTSGNKIKSGSNIKFKDYASDQLYLILRESYPNVSLEKMGVETVEEAYQATQLAIWEMALRTGDSLYGTELSKIQSIKNDMGYKNINSKVFDAAESLVRMSERFDPEGESKDVNMRPFLLLKTKNATNNGDYIGPFYYDLSVGMITNAEIEFTDRDGNVLTDLEIVDSSGAKIKDLTNTNEFYIHYNGEKHEYVVYTVKVKYNRIYSSIYEDDYSDYITNVYKEEVIDISGKITR